MSNELKEDEISFDDDQLRADSSTKPVATFAILTDVQYADVENALSFDKRMRYYRNSLNLVREAVLNWRTYSQANSRPIKFLLQLGDLVDGKCKHINDSDRSMNQLLDELNALFKDEDASSAQTLSSSPRVLNIWGNHEFYNFNRDYLLESPLNTARLLGQNQSSGGNYYTYEVTPKLRLICLDFYEYSILGYDDKDPVYVHALDFLRQHNKNQDLNMPDGLRGHAQRFTGFNGSPSAKQLQWFADELKACEASGSYAIVCGHLPIHAQASDPRCLAWNAKDMLELLWSYDRTVVAYLAGHDHQGGYFRDKRNIHHLTLKAIIETPPNSNAYATVNVYDDRVSIEGVGAINNYQFFFDRS